MTTERAAGAVTVAYLLEELARPLNVSGIAQPFSEAREIVSALYERVLARKPTVEEQSTCTKYIAKVGERKEALEDVLWALVNSTEFLIKK